ncbi:MAG: SMP-30/gluconolactonase/LRE family protein [Rhodopirellula sp.]|nr:SMP-30/gluconolactonase/LRE family protein [Rhodopirellula sp.]
MVNLHRWLRRTSPHLVIAGSLVITGLSGCRSVQHSAVNFEPATSTSTYPAPLLTKETLSDADSNVASAETDGDLFLEPPAPPLPVSRSNSLAESPPKLPLPEIDTLEGPPYEASTEVDSESESVAKEVPGETTATVADTDPLAESNLFPNDDPQSAQKSTDTVVTTDDQSTGRDKASTNSEPITDPFADSLEPTVANPEIPVPNPGKNVANDVSAEEQGSPLIPVEPRKTKPTFENDAPIKEPSSLFPPPATTLPQPLIEPDAGELPVTSPKADSTDASSELNAEAAASLPTISPAVVADISRSTLRLNIPLPEISTATTSEETLESDRLEPEQLASITKPDSTISTTEPLNSSSAINPLFPTASPRSTNRPDVISVVAEVWSPADTVVFDDAGNAFVSHGKHISKISSDGIVEPWATMVAPRGHVVLSDGSHLVADAGQRAIVKLNANGEQLGKLATRSDGHFLRAPNDLVVDSNGGVYFTDPGYARIRNPIGRIHYVAADGTVTVVAQRLAFPEGIAFSSDGSKLLVVESQSRQVVAFEIRSPGQVGPKQVFAELPAGVNSSAGFASGLIVDQTSGRVFVALGERQQVEMLSPGGQLLRSFKLGATVNDVAFKGNDFSRLFTTGGAQSGNKNVGQVLEIPVID